MAAKPQVNLQFAVDMSAEAMANSREMNYVKGLTGAALTQKGTFAETYATGTAQMTGRTKGTTRRMNFGDDEPFQEPLGNLTVSGAVFIFANDVIGPGLVGVSFVASNSGIFPFILFMVISCVSMIWALDVLCACGVMAGIKNYESVGVLAIGPKGLYLTSIAIAAECFGALIAYVVMIGNTFPVGLAWMNLQDDIEVYQMQIAICIILVFPICCLKDLNALSFTAMYSAVVFTCVMLTNFWNAVAADWYETYGKDTGVPVPRGALSPSSTFCSENNQCAMTADGIVTHVLACPTEEVKLVADNLPDLFGNLPTLIFAMSCVPSALPVFAEMADGKFESMKSANRISIVVSASLYVAVAISGYMYTRANTFSNNLLNMRQCICYEYEGRPCQSSCVAGKFVCLDEDLWGGILNVSFGLAIIAGYATMHYVLRKSVITVIWGDSAEFSWPIHCGVAAVIISITAVIAILASDVEVVFNWAGTLGVPLVGFVLPGMYFNILLKTQEKNSDGSDADKFAQDPFLSRTLANVLLGAGIFFMVGGTAMELLV